jgi:restriction system protein
MPNAQLDQFTGGLISKMLPLLILAGFVGALGKGRKRSRSGRVGPITVGRKSGWADDLVLAPWWVSFGLALLVFVLVPRLTQAAAFLAPLFGLFLLCLSGISVLRKWKTGRMLDGQTGLDSIRDLPWKRFEDLLGEAYRRQGYKVEETLGGGADGGVDLVLRRNGDMTLVQCKRWKDKPVPVQTVRELYGLMHDRHASAAKVVATTIFTPDAAAFAMGKPIELVDANGLLRLLQTVQASGRIVVSPPLPERDHLTPDCPRCGSARSKRGRIRRTKFLGLSEFS